MTVQGGIYKFKKIVQYFELPYMVLKGRSHEKKTAVFWILSKLQPSPPNLDKLYNFFPTSKLRDSAYALYWRQAE